MHLHIAVRGADRALAVYNALRERLPLIAAVAANAPLYDGADSGLASVRPLLGGLLPRQGVPPAFASWDEVAATHAWGQTSGRVPDAASWWWEARLHPQWGTIEVRVPDTQATVAESATIAAFVHNVVAELAARATRTTCQRRPRPGGSPRTAGARAATASTLSSPTHARALAPPSASWLPSARTAPGGCAPSHKSAASTTPPRGSREHFTA